MMELVEIEEPCSLRRILPLEKIDEAGAEMKESNRILEQEEEQKPDDTVLGTVTEEVTLPSTSELMGLRSPRTEIEHHWQVMTATVKNNVSSDEEELENIVVLLEGMHVDDSLCSGDNSAIAEGEIDTEEQENWDCENDSTRANAQKSWLTTVGPIKNIDSDPTDLCREVDYGKMQEVEEVSVSDSSAPAALHTTLDEISQKRRSLGKMVRNASRRLTTTASLPRDLGLSPPQNLRTSAASMLRKGRTLLRNTGKLLRPGKAEKSYFTCKEAGKSTQDDMLSDQVDVHGDSPTVNQEQPIGDIIPEKVTEDAKDKTSLKKRGLFNLQSFRKQSIKSKEEEPST